MLYRFHRCERTIGDLPINLNEVLTMHKCSRISKHGTEYGIMFNFGVSKNPVTAYFGQRKRDVEFDSLTDLKKRLDNGEEKNNVNRCKN